MKKSYLINLVLIIVIIGLYWLNNTAHQPQIEMAQLTTIVRNDIHHISISRLDSTDVELEKVTSGWQITKPIKAPANTKRIELLLSFLETPSYAQIEADDAMLSKFELKPANIVLTLDDYTVAFGAIEPLSKHRYVLIDNMIHLITDRVTPLLNANATSFIENKLIANKNIITKMALPVLNNNIVLSESVIIENNNGHWQSDLSTISTDTLTALVENWQHAYALQVRPLKQSNEIDSSVHKVYLWFNHEKQAVKYHLKLSDNALFIFNEQQQLSYQFTRSIVAQLLPNQPIQQ